MRRQAHERRACICAASIACAGNNTPTVKVFPKASTLKKDAAVDQQPEKPLKGIQLQRAAVKMAARRELAQRFGGSAADANTAVFVSLLHLHPAARATGKSSVSQLGFTTEGLQGVLPEGVDQYFIKVETSTSSSSSSSSSSSTYLPRFNYPLPEPASGAEAAHPPAAVVQSKKRQHPTMDRAVAAVAAAAELQQDLRFAGSLLTMSATTAISAAPLKKVRPSPACTQARLCCCCSVTATSRSA